MARRVRGENREAKNNGRRAPAVKAGGTLDSCPAEGEGTLYQRTAELAYVLYERSGFQEGKDLEHWLEAERQVKGVRGQAA